MHTKQADNFISIANYHNHQIIFHKGQEARDIFIIEDGWVEIFDPSTDRVISLLKKGHLIGEQALCQLGIRIASARARGEVRCQQLPIENVRKLLSLDYGFITAGLEGLCLQLATLNHFSEFLAAKKHQPMIRSGLQDLLPNQAHEYLKKVFKQGELLGDISPEEFIYIKVLTSVTQKKILFNESKFNNPVSPQQAFMILSGEVKATWGSKTMAIGSGAVFGLAESLLGGPWLMTGSPLSAVSAQMFPVKALVSSFGQASPGIVGICRALALKVVDAYYDLQEQHIDHSGGGKSFF